MKLKKLLSVLLIVTMGIATTACSSSTKGESKDKETVAESTKEETNSNSKEKSSEPEKKDSEKISAEKKLTNVEVTLPASFFEGSTKEDIQASAKESGIKDVKLNDDGSVVYVMSKAEHKELLDSMKTGIDESIKVILDDKETYPSFIEVTYNDDCTEFTVLCDGSKYSEFDSLAAMSFYMQGLYYQAFNGVAEDKMKAVVYFKDKDSGEILDTSDSSELSE